MHMRRTANTSRELEVQLSQQVPAVSLEIPKHRDAAVRFGARRTDELHARGDQAPIRRLEVVHAQEESDPARELIADERLLLRSVGASEHETGAATGRANHDPAFR